MSYECIFIRLMKVTRRWNSKIAIFFTVHAPVTSYDDEYVEEFYLTLQEEIIKLSRKSEVILIGDLSFFNSAL